MIATIGMGATAQTYYDLTQYYLQNPDFTANVDYDINAAAENVKNSTLNTPKGWTLESASKANFAVVSTFQYGTKATFVNKAIPATGPDGTTNGVCLTLSAALGNHVTFYQSAKLPAGNYMLLVTYYNCNDASETATSLNGWFVNASDEVISQTTTFGFGEWRTDTVAFTLTDITDGRLQIGTKCSGTAVKNALLAVDNVRLLRDTPYGEQDNLVPPPTVTADPRFARGATMAFGRIKKVTGENITERGFCWSETPEPTINDNFTTDFLTNNGTIYVMRDLKPATIYYMRAYAKNSYGKVGYGEVIKFATVPKGNVTYWYNNGGDDAANKRVNTAAQSACDIFNNLTEIVKHFNIGYSAGTPTADCYYADEPWMNMGANSSYQRTGTIMHEMQHGLGLVPYTTQWNKNILRERLDGDGRGTGHWLGERVSAFLDFWDDTTDSQLNGDFQHMWPYGINGANEDNGKLELYYANAMIGQALGEDGLEHRSNTFAEPCYIFTQEDDVKYYLKNEDESRGLYTSYLVPTATGILKWRTMSASEAEQNDSAAWYITFTPDNQYYQLRNAATGQYLTYANSFKTVAHATPTAADNFHLMKGRVNVGSGVSAQRCYWLVHPTSTLTPNCLQANANGAVGSATFDIKNSATRQRWLILTAEQAAQMEQASVAGMKEKLTLALVDIKKLAKVPHVETAKDADATFDSAIANIEQRAKEATTVAGIIALQDEANAAAYQFLCSVSATDKTKPFDLTYMIANPGMDATDGWTGSPTLNYSCAEFFEKTFNFNQTISNLPAGDYQVLAQGFQRPGASADVYTDYTAGTNNVTAYLYAGNVNNNVKMAHIASEAKASKIGVGAEVTVGSNRYIPNDMQAASAYFAKGLYENVVDATVASNGDKLLIGVRSTSMPSKYWTIFDNFRLHFFGKPVAADKGDVNQDGVTDVADILSIIGYMTGTNGTVTKEQADANGDGNVDYSDIATIINNINTGK
ncbi:MAG: hypothetical protein IKR50_01950 [Prevotella sp.]|nr:hypothetical protein [Prevotella sp.]